MSKFKVGDHVIGNAKADRYNITGPGWCGVVVEVDDRIVKVRGLGLNSMAHEFPVMAECFDLAPDPAPAPDKIVVTTEGKTTTARMYAGKVLVKSAEAKCSPRDEFNFETGAALALDRLLGREVKPEPQKLFPLEEIKAGYLLKIRERGGEEYFMTVSVDSYEDLGCCCPGQNWWPLHSFTSGLSRAGSTVVAVYGPTSNRYLLDNSPSHRELLWSRV